MDKIIRMLIVSNDAKLREILHFCFDGWGYDVTLWDQHKEDVELIKRVSPDVIVFDVHSARANDLKICSLLKNDCLTASIPIITLINKRHLRSHLLSLKYGVDDYLIKPPDPLDLRVRIEMAVRRFKLSFHANPLTGLPGARVLEEVVRDRLKKGSDFTMGYLDLDNFKSYNDVYGYLKGDNVIMHTAYILYSTLKQAGNDEDMVSHIGGDDFAFITTPDKYETVCQNFIFVFDRVTPFHYPSIERKQGYVVASDRTKQLRKIPLMSVSMAVANVKKGSCLNDIIQINERIAEIKKYLKTMPGSKYMADRRDGNPKSADSGPLLHKLNYSVQPYRPLGQILLEKKLLSDEQLEEALRMHWKRGVVLGEVLQELKFVREEALMEALRLQESFSQKI
ncbi:MAG: diguanylate cyclase [Candidatus Omnitrophica bacterium]|nr:diguanylate cyclase [Candidatus Omnitrophota bacterium]